MRVTARVLINSIGFLVMSLGLSFLFAVQILPTVFGSSYTIHGLFPDAGGVFTNQEVTYRGVQVGRVGEMTLTREAVSLEMIIDAKYNNIPREGTRARILYKSAVGEQFIDLLPETTQPPYFEGGETIPLDMTSIPIQTEDLLRDLDTVLGGISPAAIGTVVSELGTGLGGHGQDLKQIVLALETLSRIGAEQSDLIGSGTRASADVQAAFNRTRGDFVQAAGSLRRVSDVLARRRAEVGATLQHADVLNQEIIALLRNRRTEINQVVADLAGLTRITHDQRTDLDRILRFLGPMLGDIYRAYAPPYFKFNLVTNPEQPACSYNPSSRPVRAVTDTSFKEPGADFACPAGFDPQSARSANGTLPAESIPPVPPPRTDLERLLWFPILGIEVSP